MPPRIIRRTLERSTDLEGRILHYVERTSRRPWVKVHPTATVPAFEDKRAVFEVEVTQGRPDRYVRRIE